MITQVVQETDQKKEGDELLSAFNVATFKAEEDDAAFWNRLIPVSERPKAEPDAVFQNLGTRSTRFRATDDVRPQIKRSIASSIPTSLPILFC